MSEISTQFRTCLCDPVPDIAVAADFLDAAVSAHLAGKRELADDLIRRADIEAIFHWAESLWGKGGPHGRPRSVANPAPVIPKAERDKPGLGKPMTRTLLMRDGFHCRFCGIPLVRGETRALIHTAYPAALRWGGGNRDKHAAFLAMDLHYDHLLPLARGGKNEPSNLLVTCAPCNCGRAKLTLEEVGVRDPRLREPIRSTWDGLERFRL